MARRSKPNRYTGRGVAIYERGVTSGKSSAAITLNSEGGVTVFTGVPDVGPGIYTVIQQIVAETLEVSVKRVQVRVEDTDTVPYDTGVGGSRATNTAGHAAHQAAAEVREKLIERVAGYWDCRPEEVRSVKDSFLGPNEKRLSFQQACRLSLEQNGGSFSHVVIAEPSNQPVVTSFCVQVAEVELDPESGAVRIKRLVTAHEVGTVLNSVTHQGQIEGGVIQGMGFALMEETPLADGRVVASNMGEFKIPTVMDIPRLETIILESPTGPVPYQGKAIGEIPNVPTAAAIANAIADAAGVRFFELPITSEKLYWGIRNNHAPLLTP